MDSLIQNGANVNAETKDGWTPLMHLIDSSNLVNLNITK